MEETAKQTKQQRNKLHLSRDNVKLLFSLVKLKEDHSLSGNVEDAILEQLSTEVSDILSSFELYDKTKDVLAQQQEFENYIQSKLAISEELFKKIPAFYGDLTVEGLQFITKNAKVFVDQKVKGYDKSTQHELKANTNGWKVIYPYINNIGKYIFFRLIDVLYRYSWVCQNVGKSMLRSVPVEKVKIPRLPWPQNDEEKQQREKAKEQEKQLKLKQRKEEKEARMKLKLENPELDKQRRLKETSETKKQLLLRINDSKCFKLDQSVYEELLTTIRAEMPKLKSGKAQ